MQLVEPVEALRKAVNDERRSLSEAFDWDPDTDIRIRVFDQFNNLIRPFTLTLLFFEDYLADDSYLESKVKPATLEDGIAVRHNYLVYVKTSFIYNLTAVIESATRTLLRAVIPKNKATGEFGKVKNALLEALGNSVPEHCGEATELLFRIRNCIHNNGAHLARDESSSIVKYRGKEYRFEHGSIHNAANFETVIKLAFDQVRLMRFIVKHEKVVKISNIAESGM